MDNREYAKPELERYGSTSDLTDGDSGGTSDGFAGSV